MRCGWDRRREAAGLIIGSRSAFASYRPCFAPWIPDTGLRSHRMHRVSAAGMQTRPQGRHFSLICQGQGKESRRDDQRTGGMHPVRGSADVATSYCGQCGAASALCPPAPRPHRYTSVPHRPTPTPVGDCVTAMTGVNWWSSSGAMRKEPRGAEKEQGGGRHAPIRAGTDVRPPAPAPASGEQRRSLP